jgi:hypothetical protein
MSNIKQQIQDILENYSPDGIPTRIKHNPDLWRAVSTIAHGKTIGEKIWCFVNDTFTQPVCACGNPVSFISLTTGYREFCSKTCKHAREAATKRRIAVLEAKGGVGLANPNSKAKAKQTNLQRYGVENPFNLETVDRYRREQTHMRDPEVIAKMRADCLAEHGVDWHSKRPEIQQQMRATNLTKYGTHNPSQIHYSETTRQTLLDAQTMAKLYHENDIATMAQILSVSETTILKSLKLLNIRQPGEIVPEIQLKQALAEMGFTDFEKTRTVLPGGQELHLYSPGQKLAIEYCGLYWHSEKYKHKKYHLNKYTECKKLGIRLITVFEDEWLSHPEIVKTRLKHAVGQSDRGIFARKLRIETIKPDIAKQFFERNHLSGHSGARISYGAMDIDGNLCGCMSWSPGRLVTDRNRKSQWEMVRFATDGRNHPGIAARLFSAFVRDQNPTSAISYSDLRWGEGEYLQNLGFQRLTDSPPNYWYFSLNNPDLVRYHRFRFNKQTLQKQWPELVTTGCTEASLAHGAGLERIWDCGNAKWVWTKQNIDSGIQQ